MTRPGVTPEAVVDVAAELLDSAGPGALTLAAVAERLGVKTPSLYSHVDGIDSLRRAVALRAVDDLAEACRDAAMGRSGADAIAAISRAYRAVAVSRPGTYALTQTPRTDDAEWEKAAERVLAPILAALSGMGIEGVDAIHATRFMRSALHGFALLENGGGFGLDVDVDQSFDRLVASIIAGITA